MRNRLRALITGVLLLSSVAAIAQQRSSELKTIPDSINFIWSGEVDVVDVVRAAG